MLNESLLSPAERVTFLLGDGVITFNEGGRLMALKPDVTLSIMKNFKAEAGLCRICYDENVYRTVGGALSEIMQCGLECMGEVDAAAEYEVVRLAAESLSRIDGNYVLALSHMGYVDALLAHYNMVPADRERLLGYLRSKNLHDMERFLADRPEAYRALRALLTLPAAPEAAAEAMVALSQNDEMREAAAELGELIRRLDEDGYGKRICVDFSVVNSMKYYSGVVMNGYVNGIPERVLSGGRYDKLMSRMGKEAGAIGFALYLNVLDYADGRK